LNETPCKWRPIANTFGRKCCNCKYLQEFKRKEWKRIEKNRKNRKEQKRIEMDGNGRKRMEMDGKEKKQ
jgi:hypothetical protein